jgi:hypothetical protein
MYGNIDITAIVSKCGSITAYSNATAGDSTAAVATSAKAAKAKEEATISCSSG